MYWLETEQNICNGIEPWPLTWKDVRKKLIDMGLPIEGDRLRQRFQRAEFVMWMTAAGRVHEKSAPANPESNGTAEVSGRLVTWMGRTLGIDSGLPANMWPLFYDAAVYVYSQSVAHQVFGLEGLSYAESVTAEDVFMVTEEKAICLVGATSHD